MNSPKPKGPVAIDLRTAILTAIAHIPEADALSDRLLQRRLRSVFIVGCGGSLSAAYPAHYYLESRSTSFSAAVLSSMEFYYRRPRLLDRHSLLIAISDSGATQETLDAAGLAHAAGAYVVAITRHPQSPLARLADVSFSYEGAGFVNVARTSLVSLVALCLLDGGRASVGRSWRDAWQGLPDVVESVMQEAEPYCRDVALRLRDAPITYVVAAGPSYGVGYDLAMCHLQEEQWMHSSLIDAGEFFHGALEVVTDQTAIVVILDEANTRPLSERVREFAIAHSGNRVMIDSKIFAMPGIDQAWRGDVSPVVLTAISARIAAQLATVRNHSSDIRRYMNLIAY
jgi:fructoselysine 6-phosphate deglycase